MDESNDNNEPMEVNLDSDDSSDLDDEAEQALIARAELLEGQLSDNKYLYNVHEELVNIYRQLGDLTSMRLAYKRFHEHFPLTPEIWLAWINVEKKLANSESEVQEVFGLFDKAVQDYLSVDLWVEYAQYSLGPSNLETTRQILERGLTAAGLHTADGSLLWDTLREIELAHLSLSQEGTEQWQKQIEKVEEIFRRQLSVPLMNMENTYKEWKVWLEQVNKENTLKTEPVEWAYKKAIKTLEVYKPFEQKLQVATDEAELLQLYKDYVKVLTDPSTILCVYERAVARICLNTTLWMDYSLYALRLGEPADKITERALRNCPWSEDLWIMRLRTFEHLNKEEKDIMTCFEQGLTILGTNQSTEFWLSYLEYVCRNSDDTKKLYKTFDQALEQLKYQEGLTKITKWYARILAKNGDMPGARKLWKNILRNPKNKNIASVWMEYVNVERQYGEISHVRTIFQKALTSCTDWPEYIANEWLMFERENGKLSDVIKCAEECNKLQIQRVPTTEEQKGQKRKHENDEPEPVKKTKSEQTPPRKKPVTKDPTRTVFVSNLHTNVNEKRLKKLFPNAINMEVVMDRQGRSRCYGYVEFKMEEEVMTALARDRELVDGRPIFISNCKPNKIERKATFKYSSTPETNKLFVKGLPTDKNEDDIMEIFKAYGPKEVRLVRRRDGQPKGLAYVEFEDDESANKAMTKTDQMKIGENVITVVISAPPAKKPNVPKKGEPVRHARSKLQVPLIPRSVQVKGGASDGDVRPAPKSNEDFRNMFK